MVCGGVASLPHKCQHPSPPLDSIRVMVNVWRLRGNIIRTAPLRAGLCDTMFTVSSTLIWAVLTGPADWVCHIGTLTPCIEAVA